LHAPEPTMNPTAFDHESPATATGYAAARRTAWIAGLTVAVVCAVLLYDYGNRKAKDPLDSPEFVRLKAELAEEPKNETLKQRIRQLDLQLRQKYFRQRRAAHFGAHLLLLMVIVLVVAEKTALTLRRRLPTPAPADPSSQRRRQMAAAGWARASVMVLLVAVAGLAGMVAAGVGTHLPGGPAQLAAVSHDYPTDEQIARNWPRFRGPHAAGVSAYTNIPTTWNAKSGENILWKTPVPLPGNNSPIVWGDRVFLSGADEKRREVYCFDTKTGSLLWTAEAPSTPQSRARVPKVTDDTGFAAPTMTTDGRRAYAIFANGDVVAVDFAGNVVWSRSLGIPENAYGQASSPAMYRDRLLIQFDQGADDDGLSKMIALDAVGGEPVWEVRRPVANSWGSPIVIEHGPRTQLITASDPWVIAYDPVDGKELWRAGDCISGDHGITPVVADGLLQVGNEYCEWCAIRIDGTGEVTETHVVWRGTDGLPDTVSPLVTQGLLLLSTSIGDVTCYDAARGKILWDKEFDSEFTSSPTLVGDRVYLFGKQGKGWIVRPSRDGCEVLAETDLGEPCVTSPAVQDGRLYIRGEKHLFCIGQVK